MTKTPRRFTAALKKVLETEGINAKVSSKTVRFTDLGYGSSCVATVEVQERLPDEVAEKLLEVKDEFRKGPGGPEFSEKQRSAFSLRFAGPPYPFG